MPTIQNLIKEGNLTFTFPKNSKSSKYDGWAFYRNQVQKLTDTKAVDMIYMEGHNLWLIEAKDYRVHARTNPAGLEKEVALKIRDTLAGLVAAKCNANVSDEKQFAQDALQKKHIRVVFHLELSNKKLAAQPMIRYNVQRKLRKLLRAIDAHPKVVDKNTLRPDMNWSVD